MAFHRFGVYSTLYVHLRAINAGNKSRMEWLYTTTPKEGVLLYVLDEKLTLELGEKEQLN